MQEATGLIRIFHRKSASHGHIPGKLAKNCQTGFSGAVTDTAAAYMPG